MVGLVLVSHSAALADGVAALAREMGGAEVAIEPAGGLAEPEDALGTDAERVMHAIERARSGDGVLVLMDLGSALMSAELATELLGPGEPVLLSEAPLVEGAVAAAAAARGGAPLEAVAAEARRALLMKQAQLGVGGDGAEPPAARAQAAGAEAAGAGPPGAAPEGAPAAPGEGEPQLRLRLTNPLGLHARPAARVVELAARLPARLWFTNATTGAGPARASSLTELATLGARQGHELAVRADGERAEEALAAVEQLAREGFGDEPSAATAPARPGRPAAPAPGEREHEAAAPAPAAPAPGSRLTGIAAAPGIALGAARRLRATATDAGDEPPSGPPAAEWARLEEARGRARRDLERTRAEVAGRAGESEAGIFDAHVLLLDDSALLEPARRAVFEAGQGAARAWREAVEAAAGAFRSLDDPLLRERAGDVSEVGERVLAHLSGAGGRDAALSEPGILVADDLTPGRVADLDRDLIRGIATARGSASSHAAILARSLDIPAVVGLGSDLLGVEDGRRLALDADAAALVVEPDARTREELGRRRRSADARRAAARAHAREPAVTRDGVRIEVAANLSSPAEVADAIALGAEGVGVLRTEFLFLDRPRLPDEEEQLAAYREIAAALDGRPLVVRTLDVGADKPLPALPQPPEANPFLGRRGLRLALAEPEVLRVQLRAVLRAAAEHPLKVMFPMVTTLAELRAAREVLDEQRGQLGLEAALEVGIMVEVPAVALLAERFAREVDFFSLGTNDLAQYTMAAERGDERLAYLTDGPVPALLRLIRAVARAGAAGGRWVGVCGELAGDPLAAALLVGLGVTELSMVPASIPEVKQTLRGLHLRRARELAERACELDDTAAVRELAAPLVA